MVAVNKIATLERKIILLRKDIPYTLVQIQSKTTHLLCRTHPIVNHQNGLLIGFFLLSLAELIFIQLLRLHRLKPVIVKTMLSLKFSIITLRLEVEEYWGTWRAQSVEHVILNLRVVSSRPMLDKEFLF